MALLDTNVIIRHLTRDHPDHSQRALTFLQTVQTGERTVFLTEGVLVEIVQVLSSKESYSLPRVTIREQLSELLRMPGIESTRKETYIRTLDIYAETPRLSFVDSMLVAYAELEETPTVVSFDRGFRRIPSISWEEP